ncbi:MAG TPA: peptidoglycan-binding protein [Candidatus Gracilibacteria bacterium]|nr:peptidoglycan-binding protein [Candidatus Gracilibacteria bacterium]
MKNYYQIVFTSLLFSLSCLPIWADESSPDENQNYEYYFQECKVSAYYSPLPNQIRYLRGSYEADLRLNGNGTNGADGTPVYVGMLAAPKAYEFGTAIEVPGLGVGIVHDRGGAIIENGNVHRLDVWMGSGDEGLNRALNWGMRTFPDCKVYFKPVASSVKIDSISAAAPKKPAVVNPELLSAYLQIGQVHKQIPLLKKKLKSLGYFSGEVANDYFGPDLKTALAQFQIDQKIIPNLQDAAAGSLGPKTLAVLNKSDLKPVVVVNSTPAPKTNEEVNSLDSNEAQIALKLLNYYHNENDFKNAIFDFQRDQGIVTNWQSAGAGIIGPKTTLALKTALQTKINHIENLPAPKKMIIEGEKSSLPALIAIYQSMPISFPQIKTQHLDLKNSSAEYARRQGFLVSNPNSTTATSIFPNLQMQKKTIFPASK